MSNIGAIQKVHFIGIGGIGMSALARLFVHEGKVVSGSDAAASDNTKALGAAGVTLTYGHTAATIADDVDLVIYTEAISKEDNPEYVRAMEQGIQTINYFEALGLVANEYYVIAVSGTHGKTTTTAMLADIFEAADFDPSVVVGSLRGKTGSNYRAGKSKYFIVEACEYKRDFLHLEPDVLVITNLEHEHVDYYADLADVQDAFKTLAAKVPEEGAVVTNVSDTNITPILAGLSAQVIDYKEYVDPMLNLEQPGLHNLMNAAAGAAVAAHEGIDREVVKAALEEFSGTWRRFEYKGMVNPNASDDGRTDGAPVYDEYAHHPTEVAAAIETARTKCADKKLTIIFQPHTFSRTEGLFDGFASALAKADTVILAPIYAARKEESSGVSSAQLAEAVVAAGGHATYIETFDEIIETVKASVSGGDVVMVMGAGDITQVASRLTE